MMIRMWIGDPPRGRNRVWFLKPNEDSTGGTGLKLGPFMVALYWGEER